MAQTRVEELTERLRESRFGREVLGPKVARPVAGWLHEHFVEPFDDAPATDTAVAPQPADEPETELPGSAPDTVIEAAAEVAEAEQPTGFVAIAKAIKDRITEHNLVVVAAGIAFWGLLAIPAVLFATVSIAGLVLDPDTVEAQVNDNLTGLPEEARTIIGEQLKNVSGGSAGGLITGLVVSLLLALWSSSGAMAKMMNTLNTIYGVVEGRSFAKLRGTALALTFGGIVFVAGAVFLLAVMPALLSRIDAIGDSAGTLFNWLRFPALALVMIVGLGVLYHIGPDRRGAKYRPLTIGAAVATLLWVSLSALFSIYTATLGSYNETYGSLGGLVVLLLWLFITAFVVLIGAEIHAIRARETAAPLE